MTIKLTLSIAHWLLSAWFLLSITHVKPVNNILPMDYV